MTDNQIFKCCIRQAINDREWMLDSLCGGAGTDQVRDEIQEISKLENRRFSALKSHELRYAMLALLYAEQWEESFADSCKGRPESKHAREMANEFKSLRHRVFGKTKFEAYMESATVVSVESMIRKY